METAMISYKHFAKLLAYPSADFAGIVLDLVAHSSDTHLSTFAAETTTLSRDELEELYTRTFDINPISSLEIGWHLYGETYERGSFLVKMRQLLKSLEIPESSELPDHLSHVLLALDKLGESNEADELANQYIHPALAKILEGFKEKNNPYEHILLALQNTIRERHTHGVTS